MPLGTATAAYQEPFLGLVPALAGRSRRPAGKLALHDLHDHANQQASHGHAAGGRQGSNAPHARAVGCSSCRAKYSWPRGNPDLSVGSAVKLLLTSALRSMSAHSLRGQQSIATPSPDLA